MAQYRKTVCVIGSTRFLMVMDKVCHDLALEGHIVLRPHVMASRLYPSAPITEDQREAIHELREAEVIMADEIFVVNPDHYIGETTTHLIGVARRHHKPIQWLHVPPMDTSPQYN